MTINKTPRIVYLVYATRHRVIGHMVIGHKFTRSNLQFDERNFKSQFPKTMFRLNFDV